MHRSAPIQAIHISAAKMRPLVPAVLALATFVAGAVLIFSGATPPVRARLRLLHDVSPAPLIEGAYFLASLTGAALLLVARGLWRRVDGARVVAMALLAAGVILSIMKGLDYEEAIYLACVLLALAPARRHFTRRSALLAVDFGVQWIGATATVLVAGIWLVIFSHRHVLFSDDEWWHFTLTRGASRALGATLGAAIVAVLAGLARLLRVVQPPPPLPDAEDLARAEAIIERIPRSQAHLALLGDKALLFDDTDRGFLMYGMAGRHWVSMGDPVGCAEARATLAWRFRELADRHGGRAVFYQVSKENLPLYLDLGLTLRKLGESARVPLQPFTLEGGTRKWLRRARRTAIDAGCSFEVVPATAVREILPDLRCVSDAWLASRKTREKGFSLGFYDEPYLERFPVAVVRLDGRLVAFANLWPGDGVEELSVDLVRYLVDTPVGLTDYLLSELMLWGSASGYRWFDLGMAPLSGLEHRRLAPVWNQVGGLLFHRGGALYNFEGLRRYKEKFDPVWEPRYLAAPGTLGIIAALRSVATLVSRGASGTLPQPDSARRHRRNGVSPSADRRWGPDAGLPSRAR